MSPEQFIQLYRKYFGASPQLPIAAIYTDEAMGEPKRVPGCMFKRLPEILGGEVVSLDKDSILCGGGKVYAGYARPSPQIFDFVSLKEKYKLSPELAGESIQAICPHSTPKRFLNFCRLDRLDDFEGIEGLIFFVDPDVLSGLFAWANYDQGDINSVQIPWGSGCSATLSALINENKRDGYHCFIGMLDISARLYCKPWMLSFAIPMSRLSQMLKTFSSCCVAGARDWNRLRERME